MSATVRHAVSGEPNGLALSPCGKRFAVSFAKEHCVAVYATANGAELVKFGTKGAELGMFDRPLKIAFHPKSKNILVADCQNKRLQEVTSDGLAVRVIGTPDACGFVVGVACNDTLVAASKHGFYEDGRVMLFSYDTGALLKSFGSWGQDVGQLGHCGGIRFTADGLHVVVASGFADSWQLSQWTVDGKFVKEAGRDQLTWVRDVEITRHGDWIACEGRANAMMVFSGSEGRWMHTHDTKFIGLSAAVQAPTGELWVSDRNRVQVFAPQC